MLIQAGRGLDSTKHSVSGLSFFCCCLRFIDLFEVRIKERGKRGIQRDFSIYWFTLQMVIKIRAGPGQI